jgi:capsular polysaccharide biosynthesis protein
MGNEINVKDNFEEGLSLRDLLLILKRNLLFMAIIVIIFAVVGGVFVFTQKPTYTSTEKVMFTATNIGENNSSQGNYNSMYAYVDTVMDFCDEGVVLDRANYYYTQYLNNKQNYDNIEDYIKYLSSDLVDPYKGQVINEPLCDKTKVSVSKKVTDETTVQFSFNISYTDDVRQDAYDKNKILVYAFSKECRATGKVGESTDIKYFGGMEVSITDMGNERVAPNSSKKKTLILFAGIGVVVALVAVYVRTILDNTIKSKDELEALTNASLLASVENKE